MPLIQQKKSNFITANEAWMKFMNQTRNQTGGMELGNSGWNGGLINHSILFHSVIEILFIAVNESNWN